MHVIIKPWSWDEVAIIPLLLCQMYQGADRMADVLLMYSIAKDICMNVKGINV
jgi:hypothetical protein